MSYEVRNLQKTAYGLTLTSGQSIHWGAAERRVVHDSEFFDLSFQRAVKKGILQGKALPVARTEPTSRPKKFKKEA